MTSDAHYSHDGPQHEVIYPQLRLHATTTGRDQFGRLRAEVTAATHPGNAYLNRKVIDLLNERECRQFAEDCAAVDGQMDYKIPLQFLTGCITVTLDQEEEARLNSYLSRTGTEPATPHEIRPNAFNSLNSFFSYPPWPTMHENAFIGVAGDIVRALDPHSESDPVAILLQLLTFFGVLAGRQ